MDRPAPDPGGVRPGREPGHRRHRHGHALRPPGVRLGDLEAAASFGSRAHASYGAGAALETATNAHNEAVANLLLGSELLVPSLDMALPLMVADFDALLSGFDDCLDAAGGW